MVSRARTNGVKTPDLTVLEEKPKGDLVTALEHFQGRKPLGTQRLFNPAEDGKARPRFQPGNSVQE